MLTNKMLVGNFNNGKEQGSIFKANYDKYNVNLHVIIFEVKNRQIGNLLEYTLDNDIIEYHIKKQLSYLYCNNNTIINSIDVELILQ